MFAISGCSQISMLRDFDSEVLENNVMEFITRVNDDTASLLTLTQNSLQDDANYFSSSLNPTGKYPSVQEFCNSRASFSVVMANTEGSGFVYSEKLKKLFMKIDSVCSFETRYETSIGGPYYLRAMLVSVVPESQHEPLLRCRNHQAKDEGTDDEIIKEHVIRCKNEHHEYVGSGLGAFYEDRLAVRIPLDANGEGTRLTLQFVCQNTCFNPGLRKTGLVFTLEDAQGLVWGRRVVQVKICTNFRRDMLNEERSQTSKRTLNVSVSHGRKPLHAGRPRKRRAVDYAAGPSSGAAPCPLKRKLKPEPHQLTLEMPSLRMAKRLLDSAIGIISATVLRVDDEEVKSELMMYVDNLRRQRQAVAISNSQCSVDSVLL